ncbi:hypothetical protein NW840_07995, partial [Synechococcus sp. R5-13]|uniref:hypothetical protein n=1 Tax=Synechococcus sp. R5-13 TaxID=2291953 RepID=UPI0039C0D217
SRAGSGLLKARSVPLSGRSRVVYQFGPALLASVPDEWLGRLVGVSGDLIQRCRQEMRIPAGALGCREQD